MSDEQVELPFEPNSDLVSQLASLLPRDFVNVKDEKSGIVSSYVFSLALGLIRDALANGHLIDRTNGDESLTKWDGWLVIHSPAKVFVQSNWKPLT